MTAPVTTPHFRDGGFEVTDTLLRTPRKTYRLGQVEYVSVQRPLLLFAAVPAIGMAGMVAAFWRYFYPVEALGVLGLSAATIVVALQFGTLRVHSLALRDDELSMSFGTIQRLRRVREAVERVMTARHSGSGVDA